MGRLKQVHKFDAFGRPYIEKIPYKKFISNNTKNGNESGSAANEEGSASEGDGAELRSREDGVGGSSYRSGDDLN